MNRMETRMPKILPHPCPLPLGEGELSPEQQRMERVGSSQEKEKECLWISS